MITFIKGKNLSKREMLPPKPNNYLCHSIAIKHEQWVFTLWRNPDPLIFAELF